VYIYWYAHPLIAAVMQTGCSNICILKEKSMSDTSEKTLCALQEEGFIESNTKEFIKLIRPAKYFCKNCGRSAVNSQNLCKPEKLP
jgi:hypothetical protein